MNKKELLLLYLTTLVAISFGQSTNGCDGVRYGQEVFSSTIQTTVKYGENQNFGNPVELFMDIFEPENDTLTKRPVVVLAHGGSFLTGERSDMAYQCIRYAKRGFVSATIDYRLLQPGTSLDSVNFVEAIIRAMQDMKAAVRYFRHDSNEGNTFKIDTGFIFVGGYSAGAITSLHTAYWSVNDNDIAYIDSILIDEGGLEGQSNDYFEVSSKVQGVISLSGAIIRKEWIQADEPPIVSYHGDSDNVVPIGSGLAVGAIVMDGSEMIHQQIDSLDIDNYLYVVPGGGHVDIYSFEDFSLFLNNAYVFWEDQICEQSASTDFVFMEKNRVKLFPNPAGDFLEITCNDPDCSNWEFMLLDCMGNVGGKWRLKGKRSHIGLGLTSGIYFYLIQTISGNTVKSGKIIVNAH